MPIYTDLSTISTFQNITCNPVVFYYLDPSRVLRNISRSIELRILDICIKMQNSVEFSRESKPLSQAWKACHTGPEHTRYLQLSRKASGNSVVVTFYHDIAIREDRFYSLHGRHDMIDLSTISKHISTQIFML